MRNLARAYMRVALFWLVAGLGLGLWMGANEAGMTDVNSLRYRPVHITMIMLGFLLLAVYGVIYRLWPQLEMARYATLQFWLSTIGGLLMVIGTYIQVLGGSIVIDGIGSVSVFCGAVLLAFLFLTTPESISAPT
jgi:hypothetical protein